MKKKPKHGAPGTSTALSLGSSEDRMRLSLEGSGIGTWDWSIPAGKLQYWGDGLGQAPGMIDTDMASLRAHVHPEDGPAMAKAVEDLLAGRTRRLEIELRAPSQAGRWRWILVCGNVVSRDRRKRPLRAVGILMDVTARRDAQDELRALNEQSERRIAARAAELQRESENRYRRLMSAANDAILVADADSGIILEANRRAEDLLGLPAEKIIGLHQSQIRPPEDRLASRRQFRLAAKAGARPARDIDLRGADGRRIPVAVSSSLVEIGGRKLVIGGDLCG